MACYGYHRTSTKEQHLDRGILEIRKFCEDSAMELTDIFTDQLTGKKFDRPESSCHYSGDSDNAD